MEIRHVLFSTNTIKSPHTRYRHTDTVSGHFPTEQTTPKYPYLVTQGLDPKGTSQARWAMRWKPTLNAPTATLADQTPTAKNL